MVQLPSREYKQAVRRHDGGAWLPVVGTQVLSEEGIRLSTEQ
jgi:hypothetical protein